MYDMIVYFSPDNEHAVDVESHPNEIAERHEDHLQVNVVAEDQPEPKACLKV